MNKLDLIKIAVKEWTQGELTGEQAMLRIAIVLSIRKPSKECREWAKKVLMKHKINEPMNKKTNDD